MAKKTHAQYVQELAAIGKLEVLEQYKGAKTKLLHKCLEHGDQEMVTPNNAVCNKAGLSCCHKPVVNQFSGKEISVEKGFRKGRLTVINPLRIEARPTKSAPNRKERLVDLVCDCGKETTMSIHNFLSERVQSCGCIGQEQKVQRAQEKSARLKPGMRFGKLTLIKKVRLETYETRKSYYWICRCSCGRTTKPISAASFFSGNTTACNTCGLRKTFQKRRVHLEPGSKYGRMVVLSDWGSTLAGQALTLTQCECGNQSIVQTANLKTGNTTQCRECGLEGFSRDSVEEFLNDSDKANSTCHLYMARINGAYTKPGISKDPEARADDFYTGWTFISPAITRAEAWAIEQRLLRESIDAKPETLPDIYDEWGGRTELRLKDVLPESWYISRFWELLEELDEVGWEEMAQAM